MAKALKIPRTIAGVKVPKQFRRAGIVTSILDHPVGRAILAEVLVAAATAIARHRPTGSQVAHAGETVAGTAGHTTSATTDAAKSAAGSLGSALSEVAQYVLSGKNGKNTKRKKRAKGSNYDRGNHKRKQRASTVQSH